MTDLTVLLFGAVAFSGLLLWFNTKSTYIVANLISYCLFWIGVMIASYALFAMALEVARS